MAGYTAIHDRHAGDSPRHRSMTWRTAIDADPRFDVDDWTVDNRHPTTVDGVVGRALSTSFTAALAPADQDRVVEDIRRLVEPHGPTLEFPYRSELQAWRLT